MTNLIKKVFFIMFLPISLPIWLIKKAKGKKSSSGGTISAGQSAPYGKAVDQHFQNVEAIGHMYSVAKERGDYFSKSMDSVIRACEEDIKLAPDYYKWYYKNGGKGTPPDYYSYKRLAMIYERRKEYDKAIDVCNAAIAAGFIDDGTEGGMRGRKEKLIQLKKKSK